MNEELCVPAKEFGIAAEAQMLYWAERMGYSPTYSGGNRRGIDIEMDLQQKPVSVDVKAGFVWEGRGLGFMGRRAGKLIRADYLGFVVHPRDEFPRLFEGRLEFPPFSSIHLVPADDVENVFARHKNVKGEPSGMNVYASVEELAPYLVAGK